MSGKRASHAEGGRGARKASRTTPAANPLNLRVLDSDDDEDVPCEQPSNAVAASAQRTVEALALAAAASAKVPLALSVDDARERIAQIVNRLVAAPSVYSGPPLAIPDCDGPELEKVVRLLRAEPTYTGTFIIDSSRLVLAAAESKSTSGSFNVRLTYAKDATSAPEPLSLIIGPSVSRFVRLLPYGNRAVDFPRDSLAAKTIDTLRYSATVTGQSLPFDPVVSRSAAGSDEVGMGYEFCVTKGFLERLCVTVAQLVWDNATLRAALLPYWKSYCVTKAKTELEFFRTAFEGMDLPPDKQAHRDRLARGPTEDDIRAAFLKGVVASPLTKVEKATEVGGSTITAHYWNMRLGGPVFSRVFSAEAKAMAKGVVDAEADPLVTVAFGHRDRAKSFGMVPEPFQFYAAPNWSMPVSNRHAAAALLNAHPDTRNPSYVMAWNVVASLSVTQKSVAVGKVNLVLRPVACWYLRPYVHVSHNTTTIRNPLASLGSSETAVTVSSAMDDDTINAEMMAALEAAEEAYATSEAQRATVGGAK